MHKNVKQKLNYHMTYYNKKKYYIKILTIFNELTSFNYGYIYSIYFKIFIL